MMDQATAPSITCPRCGATSYHPVDIEEGYCGRCHDWTARNQDYEQRRKLHTDQWRSNDRLYNEWISGKYDYELEAKNADA